VLAEGVFHAPGARAFDALVDREGLPQKGGGFAGVAVLEVAGANSFQGACLLQGCADLAGNGQRLAVVVAGLAGGRGPGRELAEAVEHMGLAVGFVASRISRNASRRLAAAAW
jgi:hypothetical protein